MEFFTIGVFNSPAEIFFDKMLDADVDVFCDIRQRRGVRGAEYAFVNSQRLQKRLSELNIKYLHAKNLAPTKDIRDLQKADDQVRGELKRKRTHLGTIFCDEYVNRIISSFDFPGFLAELEAMAAKRIALFCVEERPEACHRSLVANYLESEFGYKVKEL